MAVHVVATMLLLILPTLMYVWPIIIIIININSISIRINYALIANS